MSEDGLPLHSFQTLLAELATRCRNTARLASDNSRTLQIVTEPTPLQARAFELLVL
jgi:hypothetical protein